MTAFTPRGYEYPLYTDGAGPAVQIQQMAEDIDLDINGLFNRYVSGNNQPTAMVTTPGTNQACATATDVTATYTTEVFDNAAMANLGTNNTILSITASGIYVVMCRVVFSYNGVISSPYRITLLNTGGAGTVARRSISSPAASGSTAIQITHVVYAPSGSTLSMVQRQDSGASANSFTRTLLATRIAVL